MKKIYPKIGFAAIATMFAVSASAQQQLPNAGFENDWHACVPWTSSGNTKTQGETPGNWTISQVIGTGTLGLTTVGKKIAGYESDAAVSIYTKETAGNPIPGYVTLGTTWSTAKGLAGGNKDGGTFGGSEFTERPTALGFRYRRTAGSEDAQAATVVAYLWKGTYSQANVPGNIVLLGNPKTVTMVNRDRNILGMETSQGGEVTHTDGAELIAKIDAKISDTPTEWTYIEIPFEYLSDATPEMINVIFASADYWSEKPSTGNVLDIDDVTLVYKNDNNTAYYPGKLKIEMNGDPITDDDVDATVEIEYTADNTCTISLPNFALDLDGSGPTVLGDIVVPDVTYEVVNNVTQYSGKAEGIKLLEDQITADATVTGTIDNKGEAQFVIQVDWLADEDTRIPIMVTFNGNGNPGQGTSGVESVAVDNVNAPVEYFTISGVRVSGNNLPAGLYIKRQGSKIAKILVR